jgi:TonB family protein
LLSAGFATTISKTTSGDKCMKVCPKCARSFAEGFQFCPQDATELVKYDLRADLKAHDELQFLLQEESLWTRLRRELTAAREELKHDPRNFFAGLFRGEGSPRRRKRLLQTGVASAVIAYAAIMMAGLLLGLFTSPIQSSKADKPRFRDVSHDPEFFVPLAIIKPDPAKSTTKSAQGRLGGSFRPDQDSGGGGGAKNDLPARSGVPVPPSLMPQLRSPSLELPKIEHPSLVTPMTVVADPNAFLKMPGRIGDWRGNGDALSLGDRGENGIGPGQGDGYGRGRDFNVGGGDPRFTGRKPTGTGNEIYESSAGLRATIIYKERAKYTEAARENKIQGTVVLSLVFGADGRISDIRVVHGQPYGLTEEAISAAQKIRFNPAVREGKPVSVRSRLEYNFTLY